MASALYQQIEQAATLIAALTPATDASDTFVRADDEQVVAMEPGYRPRLFSVYPDGAIPATQERFGTSHRQALGRFVVEVLCDSRADVRARDQRLVEDRDQVIAAMELPASRVNASVQRVSCVDTRIDAGETDHATRLVLVFEVLYLQEI